MKRYIYLIVIVVLISVAACDDFLDKYPLDQPATETFWKTEKDVELALNGCYRLINGDRYEEFFYFWDMASDIAYSQFPWDGTQEIGNGSVTVNSDKAYWHWSKSYAAIKRSNDLLANVDNVVFVTSGLKERFMAEARYLRAWHYLLLTSLYGDVPLIDKPISIVDAKNITRTPKDQVVDLLLKDLDYAVNILPVSYDSKDVGRITKGAAYALKARAELWNGKWSDAAVSAKAVMDLGKYNIFRHYSEQFWLENENNSEVIFARQYTAPEVIHYYDAGVALSNPQGGYSSFVPTQNMVDAYLCIDGLPITLSPLYDPDMSFANRDPRLAQSIVYNGTEFRGNTILTDPGAGKWGVGSANATKSGYYLRKTLDEKVQDVWKMENDQILIRYAEVLLTYAEAKIEANKVDQSVFDAINEVRGRESVQMAPVLNNGQSQPELRKIIRNERMVELAFEGHRFFDIRRWDIMDKVMPGILYGAQVTGIDGKQYNVEIENRTYDSHLKLLPIPQKERDVNDNLKQNPGY